MATQLDTVAQLVGLLGGQRTAQTADTTALQNVLAQLQAQDPAAGIASIFQKATGQMPGIQVALGNAMGARRANNGGIEAALQKLLQDTTLAGQAQVAQQQQRNLETQGQVASSIANASKTTNQSANLGAAAKNLLLMQGLAKGGKALQGFDFKSLLGGNEATPLSTVSPDMGTSFSGDLTSSNGMDFNANPGLSFDLASVLGDGGAGFDMGNIDMGFDAGASGLDAGSGVDFGGGGLLDELADYGVFADGGLVGRDGQAPRGGDEEMAEERAQVRFDPGFTENVALDILRNIMPGFADGGSVTLGAAGGRRSSAQTVALNPTMRTGVDNTVMRPQAVVTESTSLQGLGGSGGGNISAGAPGSENSSFAQGVKSTLGTAGKVNTLAGLAGIGAIPGLGTISRLAAADTNEKALRAFALGALGLANPLLGLAASFALPATEATAVTAPAEDSAAVGAGNPDTSGNVNGGFDTGTTGGRNGGTGPGYGSSSAPDGGASMGLSMGNVLGTGGFSSPSSGGFRFASGGEVNGPGSGTSDSIPARLSDGEYVIPADVVDKLGVEFFDMLRESLHTPVAQQRK